MTNNHCPKRPARILNSRANEIAIRDFAETILEKINDFTEEFSMDNMIRIDSDIFDSWTDCSRCETAICDIQEHASHLAAKTILDFLKENI